MKNFNKKKQLEELIEKAQKEIEVPKKEKTYWQKMFVNYLLFAGYIGFAFALFMMEFDSIPLFYNNQIGTFVAKIIIVIVLSVGYIKLQDLITDFLFPKVKAKKKITVLETSQKETKKYSNTIGEYETNLPSFGLYWILTTLGGISILFLFFTTSAFSMIVTFLGQGGISAFIIKVVLVGVILGLYLIIRSLLLLKTEYEQITEVIINTKELTQGKTILEILPSETETLVYKKYTNWLLNGKKKKESMYLSSKITQCSDPLSVIQWLNI